MNFRRVRSLTFLLTLVACAGGPRAAVSTALDARDLPGAFTAYDRFRETEGADPYLLAGIAELVLEEEASSGDFERVRATIRMLRFAGLQGRPLLIRLSESEATMTKVLALEALMDQREEAARALLFGMLDQADDELLPHILRSVDPTQDGPRLLGYFAHADPAVRRVAALQFGDGENDDAYGPLVELARGDDEPRVRGAAVRALGAYEQSAPALVDRLSDAAANVRLAAARSLLRADAAQAIEVFGTWMDAPPSRASIEAARAVCMRAHGGLEEAAQLKPEAESHLFTALALTDDGPRAQAAFALISVPELGRTRILSLVDTEQNDGVRLQLARALEQEEADVAARVFRQLLSAEGMVRVQAAAALSERGEEAALATLDDVLASDAASLLRQVAARALARRAGRPEELREVLEDRDPLVRIQAAGGILAATNDN